MLVPGSHNERYKSPSGSTSQNNSYFTHLLGLICLTKSLFDIYFGNKIRLTTVITIKYCVSLISMFSLLFIRIIYPEL